MGYRTLLKEYIAHIHQVTGSDLVELGALTNAFDKRSLGELRSIRAELKRESYSSRDTGNANHLVYELLASGQLTIEDLASIVGLDAPPSGQHEQLTGESLLRIVHGFRKIEASSSTFGAE